MHLIICQVAVRISLYLCTGVYCFVIKMDNKQAV